MLMRAPKSLAALATLCLDLFGVGGGGALAQDVARWTNTARRAGIRQQ